MCTLGQPTKPQCDSDELASRRATKGCGGPLAAQKLATEKQAAALVQTKIDEKVADEMKKVAPGYIPVQHGAVPPE